MTSLEFSASQRKGDPDIESRADALVVQKGILLGSNNTGYKLKEDRKMTTPTRLTSIVIAAVCLTQFGLAQQASEDDVKRLRNFLDDQVVTLQANDAKMTKKLAVMNRVEAIVNSAVNTASADDTNSVAAAAEAIVAYQRAISAMESAANAQGKQLEKTGQVFTIVEKKEAAGMLPKGTLTVDDKNALRMASINLSKSKETVEKAKTNRNEVTDVARRKTGINIRDPGPSGPAGLEVVAHYFPSGRVNVGVAQNGFVMVVNHHRTRSVPGRLTIDVSGPGNASGPHYVTVPPGGARKINFTITVTQAGGQLSYKPVFVEASPPEK